MENKKKKPVISKEQYKRITSWARTIGYFLTLGAFGLSISSLGPVVPELAAQVSVPIDVIGAIFTARAAGFFFGSYFGGKIFDRVKGHLVMVVCFLIQSMVLAFIPFIDTFWILTSVIFVSGIALGAVVVGGSTFLVWDHSDNPAPWVSVQSFINGVGGFLSPLIISAVITRYGVYDRAYWIYALITILLAAAFFYIPSPKIRQSENKEQANGLKPGLLVYLVAIVFLLYTGSEVTYNSWIYTMATTLYPISPSNARLLNSLFWGAIAIGRLSGVIISKRLQPERILEISFIGAITSLILAIIIPGAPAVLWIASIGLGLFLSLIFPTLTLYADKKMGLTGKMTGIFFAATSIGGMIFPWITGNLFTMVSPNMVKVVVCVSLSLGLALFSYVRHQISEEI